jgi:drug/metabolite transporter (DMT)-like permease
VAAEERSIIPAGIPVGGSLLLVMICLLWGGNMVSIKISNQGLSPCLAAAARSVIAAGFLWAYARFRKEPVGMSGEDLRHGIVIGILFGLDFLFLYWGVSFTHVSRAVIFLYTHPFWTALGAHFLIPGDRITPSKGLGLALAFGGILLVFGSRPEALDPLFWVGDLMEVAAAISWAATTIYIKRMLHRRPVSHFQTLFAQLVWSVPILALAWLGLEWGRPLSLEPPVLLAFAYQCVVVAFFSYLLWFWMIHRYPVTRLAAFTFLVPCFGVLMSGLALGEPLPAMLWGGLVLVAAGIFLVNRPEPAPAR